MTYEVEIKISGKDEASPAINQTKTSLDGLGRKTLDAEKHLKDYWSQVAKADQLRKFHEEIERTNVRTESMSGWFGKTGTSLESFNHRLTDSLAGVTKFAAAAGPWAAAAGAIAGAAALAAKEIFDFANNIATIEDRFQKLSLKTGLSTETLSSWDYSARLSGVSSEQLAVLISQAQRKMGEFKSSGAGEAADVFRALGLEADISSGKLGNVDELLPVLADKLRLVEDETQKMYVAQKLFGESGGVMLQMLDGGSEALERQMEAARRYGIVVSQDAADASAEFRDSLLDVEMATLGLKRAFADELIPTLTSFLSMSSNTIVELRKIKEYGKFGLAGLGVYAYAKSVEGPQVPDISPALGPGGRPLVDRPIEINTRPLGNPTGAGVGAAPPRPQILGPDQFGYGALYAGVDQGDIDQAAFDASANKLAQEEMYQQELTDTMARWELERQAMLAEMAAEEEAAKIESNNRKLDQQRTYGQLMSSYSSSMLTQLVQGEIRGGQQMLRASGQWVGGMLAQKGQAGIAEGALKVMESLWPTNPAGLASGAGMILKGGAMVALGGTMGGSGGIGGGGSGGGGGGGGGYAPVADVVSQRELAESKPKTRVLYNLPDDGTIVDRYAFARIFMGSLQEVLDDGAVLELV